MYEPRVFVVLDRESKRQLVTPEDDTDYIDDYSDANLSDDLYNINAEEISVETHVADDNDNKYEAVLEDVVYKSITQICIIANYGH